MTNSRTWDRYPATFRTEEIKTLAGWIQAGRSGALVGLGGSGKSNLLGLSCHRPEVVRQHLPQVSGPLAIVPVDLNSLPATDPAAVHRLILRAFYEIRQRFDAPLAGVIEQLYLDNRGQQDPLLTLFGLRDLLAEFKTAGGRVVLVLDRFDHFYEAASPLLFNNLRSLRDSFKGMLSYITGSRREINYLADPDRLGEMRELLDRNVLWLGPMNEADSRYMISVLLAPLPAEPEMLHLLALSGGYPALLAAVCDWWQEIKPHPPAAAWIDPLLARPGVQYRLAEIWAGLTDAERHLLAEIQQLPHLSPAAQQAKTKQLSGRQSRPLSRLLEKKLCRASEAGWQIFSDLFARYVAVIEQTEPRKRGQGEIWLDQDTGQIFQGTAALDLAPQEKILLGYFIENCEVPGQRFSRSEAAYHLWPDETVSEDPAVSDPRLEQIVSRTRKKIEPDPPRWHYIITDPKSGFHEGGYRFYPEGRTPD